MFVRPVFHGSTTGKENIFFHGDITGGLSCYGQSQAHHLFIHTWSSIVIVTHRNDPHTGAFSWT